MSNFNFFKKDTENVFFNACEHNALKFNNYLLKNVHIFSIFFMPMDNKKGKKGKLFFCKYFRTIYDATV